VIATETIVFESSQLSISDTGFSHKKEPQGIDVAGVQQAPLQFFVSTRRERSGQILGFLDPIGNADQLVWI
jgi:hypothetical protein